jgi:sigma-B regulation protein RsbU (phosphoserine phosphatase)
MLYNKATQQIEQLTNGCVGLGMLDEIPVIKIGFINIDGPSKLICFTDGLVEYLSENKVEYATKSIENNISNTDTLEKNILEIIESHMNPGNDTSMVIFDDISILGFEFL